MPTFSWLTCRSWGSEKGKPLNHGSRQVSDDGAPGHEMLTWSLVLKNGTLLLSYDSRISANVGNLQRKVWTWYLGQWPGCCLFTYIPDVVAHPCGFFLTLLLLCSLRTPPASMLLSPDALLCSLLVATPDLRRRALASSSGFLCPLFGKPIALGHLSHSACPDAPLLP